MTGKLSSWRDQTSEPRSSPVSNRFQSSPESKFSNPGVRLTCPEGLDACMLTEAAERTLARMNVSPEEAEVLRTLIVSDVSGPVSAAFHQSRIAKNRRATAITQPEVVIKYRMDDSQMAAMNNYAREYRLRFTGRERHDHPAAAAMRIIDHKILMSRIPVNAAISDIGGNPLHYIRQSASNVHVCGAIIDKKDQMRGTLRRQAAKQLAKNDDPNISKLAKTYLAKDPLFVCGARAQECSQKADVLLAVHVYDIPMEDWPAIMEKKGASVVEGCLIHSPIVFFKEKGEFETIGARFEVDVKRDKFYMGFVNSPSWWYEHSFVDYLKYGTDQVLHTEEHAYRYRITERRGDTIFFRIMRLGRTRSPPKKIRATLKLPGAPMVKVHGFDLDGNDSQAGLLRKEYLFPRNLWYEMVAQASEDYERGALDYQRMYNHYRTMSVKSTINSIVVMGGERVSADELRPLVVHACLAATASSVLGQRETRVITEMATRARLLASQGTINKLVSVMSSVGSAIARKAMFPWEYLTGAIREKAMDTLTAWLLEWEPQVAHHDMDVLPIFCKAYGADVMSPFTMIHELATDSAAYSIFEVLRANPKLAKLREKLTGFCEPSIIEPDVVDEETRIRTLSTTAAPTVHGGCDPPPTKHEERLEAIKEHIDEIEAMNRALESTASRAYANTYINGAPRPAQLEKYSDEYANPDYWLVTNGIITRSITGAGPDCFKYSVVYSPDLRAYGGSSFMRVDKSYYDGESPGGEQVHREHHTLPKRHTGWVLVTDHMVVYNGPDILETLRLALTVRHDYEVKLERGPPGCGKTYSILQRFEPGSDVIMCPVRESVEDTRARAKKMHPDEMGLNTSVCTLDSYLTNFKTNKYKGLFARRLLADECYMAHSGKIYACAGLVGAQQIIAFGDDQQIPHIPRVQASTDHVRIRASVEDNVWTTRRCPATAVAAWGSVYEWRVRTLSPELGVMRMVHETQSLTIPEGCVMMCMYQADKLELRKRYSTHLSKIQILTAHESEGKTYKHVWLHRFDPRVRTDGSSLFDKIPHVLVAMSRHTHSFIYYCPNDLNDLVSKWIARSTNVRRVAAARQVSSAGHSLQFA